MGGVLMAGSLALAVWIAAIAASTFSTDDLSELSTLLLLTFAFCAFGASVGYGLYAGYHLFRNPSGLSIRRACLALSIYGGLLLIYLLAHVQDYVGLDIGPLAGVGALLAGGAVYWGGSRVLIRFTGVPEVMDEARRKRAVTMYMRLLAVCVWVSLFYSMGGPDPGNLILPMLVPIAIAVLVYLLGYYLLIAWDRREAAKDTPLATAVPRPTPPLPHVPDYRAAEDDEAELAARRRVDPSER
jgi:hypothetical protein